MTDGEAAGHLLARLIDDPKGLAQIVAVFAAGAVVVTVGTSWLSA